MTCTIAFLDKKQKKAYMASDSCASSSYDYSIVRNEKAFHAKSRPDILIGCAGTFRIMNVLKYNTIFGINDKVTCDYLINNFIPRFKELTDGIEKEDDWAILIATKTNIFKIQSDFAVLDLKTNIEAIGNGGYTALGAFVALDSVSKSMNVELTTEEKLKRSLQLSKKFNTGVLEPFLIIHS